jgi:hypothetical protein
VPERAAARPASARRPAGAGARAPPPGAGRCRALRRARGPPRRPTSPPARGAGRGAPPRRAPAPPPAAAAAPATAAPTPGSISCASAGAAAPRPRRRLPSCRYRSRNRPQRRRSTSPCRRRNGNQQHRRPSSLRSRSRLTRSRRRACLALALALAAAAGRRRSQAASWPRPRRRRRSSVVCHWHAQMPADAVRSSPTEGCRGWTEAPKYIGAAARLVVASTLASDTLTLTGPCTCDSPHRTHASHPDQCEWALVFALVYGLSTPGSTRRPAPKLYRVPAAARWSRGTGRRRVAARHVDE